MTTLIVVRHGQTAWNATGRFQGQADPPLDPYGWTQARAASVALAAYRPTRLVSSDLRRARQTAQVIGLRTGLTVELDRRLREVALGTWEGLDRRAVSRYFPDEYTAWAAGQDIRRGGGESEAMAGTRVADALRDAIDRAGPDDTILVVSHGLALQAGLRLVAPDRVVHLLNGRWTTVDAGGRALLTA